MIREYYLCSADDLYNDKISILDFLFCIGNSRYCLEKPTVGMNLNNLDYLIFLNEILKEVVVLFVNYLVFLVKVLVEDRN